MDGDHFLDWMIEKSLLSVHKKKCGGLVRSVDSGLQTSERKPGTTQNKCWRKGFSWVTLSRLSRQALLSCKRASWKRTARSNTLDISLSEGQKKKVTGFLPRPQYSGHDLHAHLQPQLMVTLILFLGITCAPKEIVTRIRDNASIYNCGISSYLRLGFAQSVRWFHVLCLLCVLGSLKQFWRADTLDLWF